MMKNKIIIIFFILINIKCEAFKIVKYFGNLENQNFRAEYIIKDLLEQNPLNKNITFVYAPWAKLQNNGDFNKKPNLNDIPKEKFDNAFTVCSHDDYEKLLPLFKSIGINVVFTSGGNNSRYEGIDIVTIPYFARNSVMPAKKDIFYSFVGNIKTHSCRRKIFEIKHYQKVVILKRDDFHYSIRDKKLLKKMEFEYANILSRSRFSLCPRGESPGTYRFWESLKAGAIPILISDNYQLPPGFDWSKCIVRIKESNIKSIPQILAKISNDRENEMRKNCLAAYSLYSGNNFARVIREYFK